MGTVSSRIGVLLTVSAVVVACGSDDAAQDGGAEESATQSHEAILESCFAIETATVEGIGPDYAQYEPVVGSHCFGTDHQDIDGVERVVFLGDSVTTGTAPTPLTDQYRYKLTQMLMERFGDITVESCARNGSRTDDFLLGSQAQLPQCFSEDENPGTTLVIWTMGGNDISNWAGDALMSADALVKADAAAALMDDAVAWLKSPGRFPDGLFIIYSNPYEFTDATGDLQSCELASVVVGDTENWIEGEAAVLRFQERYMEVAVKHGVDMIFALEHFCGHGYRRDFTEGRCYRGPDAELWFDLTCTHPNSAGHAKLAEMFMAVVGE